MRTLFRWCAPLLAVVLALAAPPDLTAQTLRFTVGDTLVVQPDDPVDLRSITEALDTRGRPVSRATITYRLAHPNVLSGDTLRLPAVSPDVSGYAILATWLRADGQRPTAMLYARLPQPSDTATEPQPPPDTGGVLVARFSHGCSGRTCVFDRTISTRPPANGLVTIWDFGDGTLGSGAVVTKTYDADGTYRVGLTLTHNDFPGDTSQVSTLVTVAATPDTSTPPDTLPTPPPPPDTSGGCVRYLGGGPSGPAYKPEYLQTAQAAYAAACDTTWLPSPDVTRGTPHEPTGYIKLTVRPFVTIGRPGDSPQRGTRDLTKVDSLPNVPRRVYQYQGATEGWDASEASRPRITQGFDPNAPESPPGFMRWNYPADMPSGVSPGTSQTVHYQWLGTSGQEARLPVRELYISQHIRISRNWSGNQSNTNKMPYFVGIGGGNNQLFPSAEGKYADPLRLQYRMQGIEDPRSRLVTSHTIVRGQWEHWEFRLVCNSAPHAADGQIWVWVNSQLVGHWSDVNFTKSSGNEAGRACTWDIVSGVPVFGGGGAYVPHYQFVDVDHVYVSGRP